MYSCIPCKFQSTVKFNYNRHCLSVKHIDNIKKAANKINSEMMCMNCKHKYKHASSFYRHRKNCKVDINNSSELNYNSEVNLEIEKLKYENQQIISQIKELTKTNPIINDVIIKPKKRKVKIPAAVRKIVWNTYIGKDKNVGKCLCCDAEDISYNNFECGHIINDHDGGEVNIENLRPICGHCNKSIGSKNMDQFMTLYKIKKLNNWNGIIKSEN